VGARIDVQNRQLLYRTLDNGKTWEYWVDLDKSFYHLVKNSKGILFSTPHSSYVYRSTDGAKTWEYLPNSKAGGAIAINNQDHIITMNSGYSDVYKSTDNGDTWFRVFEGEYIIMAYCAIFHPHKPIGIINHMMGNLISRDNGDTWEELKGGPWSRSWPKQMAVDSLGNFWGGAFYRSSDDGETWEVVDSGVDPAHRHYVYTMEVSPQGYIYVSTWYGGLYRSREAYVSVQPEVTQTAGFSASPNPFSERTQLSFTLTEPGYIRLELYDVLGRSLRTLSSGWYDAGWHSVNIDADGIPTGMYYVLLTGGNARQIQKIGIMR
jgi:photosystem II stability/assembly factor-like uncharacterized protein